MGNFCRSRKRDIEPSCLGISTRRLMTSSSVSRPTTLCSGGSDAAVDTYKLVGSLLTRGWPSYVRTRNTDMRDRNFLEPSFKCEEYWFRSRRSTDSGLIMTEKDHGDQTSFLKSYHAYSACQPAKMDVQLVLMRQNVWPKFAHSHRCRKAYQPPAKPPSFNNAAQIRPVWHATSGRCSRAGGASYDSCWFWKTRRAVPRDCQFQNNLQFDMPRLSSTSFKLAGVVFQHCCGSILKMLIHILLNAFVDIYLL